MVQECELNDILVPAGAGEIVSSSTRVHSPNEEELRERMLEHFAARPDDPLVAAAWNGTIAALSEWGVINDATSSRLNKLLPEPGRLQVVEILIGPDYVDKHPEVKDDVAAAGRRRAAPSPPALTESPASSP